MFFIKWWLEIVKFWRSILSPLRLPFRHSGICYLNNIDYLKWFVNRFFVILPVKSLGLPFFSRNLDFRWSTSSLSLFYKIIFIEVSFDDRYNKILKIGASFIEMHLKIKLQFFCTLLNMFIYFLLAVFQKLLNAFLNYF